VALRFWDEAEVYGNLGSEIEHINEYMFQMAETLEKNEIEVAYIWFCFDSENVFCVEDNHSGRTSRRVLHKSYCVGCIRNSSQELRHGFESKQLES